MTPIDPVLTRIGAATRKSRVAAGLSIARLASLAGMDPGFLAYIEAGKKAPSVLTLARLASALQVPLSALVDHAGAPENGGAAAPSAVERRVKGLWALARRSRSHRRHLLCVLDMLHDPRKARAICELGGPRFKAGS